MSKINLTSKTALVLFISITLVLFAQAVWWIVFMAQVLDEKVDIAIELGADGTFIEKMHQQEVSRQIMVGLEGVFFLLLVGIGAWLIYRTLVKSEALKFHQQNFLMAVTHELKTPLASMKIYLDSLQSPKISQEKKNKIIPRLKDDTKRLEKLVENILDAGRFERSGYQLVKEKVNFSKLIENKLNDIRKYPADNMIQIDTNNFKTHIFLYGDPKALGRAIEAILENCIKYNDKDVIKLKIELYDKKKIICLNIADNGVGLNKKDITQIFDRFYRVGQEINRTVPGSGLGLYLCREIIKAHHGKITAQSEGIGKGVVFHIKLRISANYENYSSG